MAQGLILLALALTQAAPALNHSGSGCAMLAAGKSSQAELDRHYGLLAVEILRLARTGDQSSLGTMVSPDFSYQITDADSIHGPRKEKGPEAVISLSHMLAAKHFRISSPFTVLSVAPTITLTCEWRVNVVFEKAHKRDAVSADFEFVDDKLIRVNGQTLVETREAMSQTQV